LNFRDILSSRVAARDRDDRDYEKMLVL
jgi:hypothetical protein